MANETHFYVTVQGDYTSTSLANEVWQFGTRWIWTNVTPDPIGTLPQDLNIVADSVNRNETAWTIVGNWGVTGAAASSFHADDWLNDQLAPAVQTMFNNTRFGSMIRVRTIKVYPIGSNGRAIPAPPYAQGTPMLLTYKSGNYPVGTGATMLPPQTSCVVSLRTGQTGRRGKGRLFLPPLPTAQMSSSDGLLATGTADGVALLVANFLTAGTIDLEVPTGSHTRPIVTGSPWTNYATVVNTAVGNVFDTQRRRRAQLDEVYSLRPVPTP